MKNNFKEKCHERCKNDCTKEQREIYTKQGLCTKEFSNVDELPVRCVGEWAKEKIYRLKQYFGIFSVGMKNKWPNKNYIEICSGPGRCIERESGEEFDGTPLSILNHKSFEFIKNAIFIDLKCDVVSTLNERIKNLEKSSVAKAIKCDYNNTEGIESILSGLTHNSLNLVFLDPTDCSIPFSLFETINNSLKNVDFIVNLAFGTDLIRNLRQAILNEHYKSRNKYLTFLGSDDFFDRTEMLEIAKEGTNVTLVHKFYAEYKKNLSNIGYKHSDARPVKQFYYIFFTAKHPKGLEFWEKANQIDPNGQHDLFR